MACRAAVAISPRCTPQLRHHFGTITQHWPFSHAIRSSMPPLVLIHAWFSCRSDGSGSAVAMMRLCCAVLVPGYTWFWYLTMPAIHDVIRFTRRFPWYSPCMLGTPPCMLGTPLGLESRLQVQRGDVCGPPRVRAGSYVRQLRHHDDSSPTIMTHHFGACRSQQGLRHPHAHRVRNGACNPSLTSCRHDVMHARSCFSASGTSLQTAETLLGTT